MLTCGSAESIRAEGFTEAAVGEESLVETTERVS